MGETLAYTPLLLPWLQVAGYGNKYLRQNGEETRISAKQVEESVNGSLSRLGTDHIDLLQVGQLSSPHRQAFVTCASLRATAPTWPAKRLSSPDLIGQKASIGMPLIGYYQTLWEVCLWGGADLVIQ